MSVPACQLLPWVKTALWLHQPWFVLQLVLLQVAWFVPGALNCSQHLLQRGVEQNLWWQAQPVPAQLDQGLWVVAAGWAGAAVAELLGASEAAAGMLPVARAQLVVEAQAAEQSWPAALAEWPMKGQWQLSLEMPVIAGVLCCQAQLWVC